MRFFLFIYSLVLASCGIAVHGRADLVENDAECASIRFVSVAIDSRVWILMCTLTYRLPVDACAPAHHLGQCQLSDADVCTQCTPIVQTKQNEMKKTRIRH